MEVTMKKIISFMLAVALTVDVSLYVTNCTKLHADEPAVFSSYSSYEHEYSILDIVELNSNDTIPCYDCSSSMTSTKKLFTFSLSQKDKQILQNFMDEHFKEGMTNTEKIEYTIEWLHNNINYAATSAECSKLSSSTAECGFVQKSGQCLQYNGALACMLAYMGYETNLIYLKNNSWQHYTCQVRINGRVFRMEAGNKGLKDGSHYMPMSMLKLETDMNTDEDKIIGQCGSTAYYTFTKSTGCLVIDGTGTASSSYDTFWEGYTSDIKSIVIENNITEVLCEFSGLSNLTDVSVPDSVRYISPDTFDNTPFIDNQPDMIVLGRILYRYKGNDTCVSIPENVKYLGINVFKDCSNLESIALPDGIESIPGGAFDGCTSLSEVQFPDSIESIGSDAFRNCSSLKEITLPDNLTEIYWYAFYGCKSLTNVNFNSKLKTIGECAFQNCENLISVNIPDSATDIQNSVFSCCYALKDVRLPEHISEISSYMFSYCTNLEKITIPDNVTTIESFAFADCTSLKEITIPDNTTTIEVSAFRDCTGLEEITIPDSVTTIEASAFEHCTMLKSVNINNNISYIGESAFDDTPFITNSEEDFIVISGYLYSYNGNDSEIIIPENVTTIGCNVFKDNTNIKKVAISDSVTSIGSSAFYGCTELTDIYIPESVQYIESEAFYNTPFLESQTGEFVIFGSHLYRYNGSAAEVVIPDNIVSIGESAFYQNKNISSVVFPENLKLIGNYAFYECDVLSSLVLPENLEIIGGFAFGYCTGLSSINLPENIEEIGVFAFSNCSFTEVTLPDNIETIQIGLFFNCTNLKKVTIPASVKSIEDKAFINCEPVDGWEAYSYSLEEINYTGSEEQWEDIVIYDYFGWLRSTKINFLNLDYISGDIDNDRQITSNDALDILKAVTGSIELDSRQIKAADLNNDGNITSADALNILQIVVGYNKN